MANYHPSMQDLYERLAKAGLGRAFVRKAVLPSWWKDDLADTPANRQLAEMYLAQSLSLDLEALQNPDRVLILPVGEVRFKRSQRADQDKAQPTAFIARQVGEMLAESILGLPPYTGIHRPMEVRRWISYNGFRQVNLRSLIAYCWAHGIVVFHLGYVPPGAHKLDGMVMFSRDRPVIMLGSGRQFDSWLAFDLAHELGHLIREHVKPGGAPLVDLDLESVAGDDRQEREANEQGLTILTGEPEPDIGLPAETQPFKLMGRMESLGEELGVDPGVLILIHAQRHKAWKEAARSLQYLAGPTREHPKVIIDKALLAHVNLDDFPKSVARFLDATLSL